MGCACAAERVPASLHPCCTPYLAPTQSGPPCAHGDLKNAVVAVFLIPDLLLKLLCRCLEAPWISLCWGCMISMQLQLQHPALQPQDLWGELGELVHLPAGPGQHPSGHTWAQRCGTFRDSHTMGEPCHPSRGAHLQPPIALLLGMRPAKGLGWHMWAHINAHLTLQLKDFSLVLLPQTMGCDVQVDQLLGDLWVAGVRGGACGVPVGSLPSCSLLRAPVLTFSRCSSLSSRSEGSSVLRLVTQAGVSLGTPGSESSVSGRTWGGTTTHPTGGSQA